MKTILLICSMALLSGCATKGGWPCWAWDKNTDQKEDAWAKNQLKHQSQLTVTNQP